MGRFKCAREGNIKAGDGDAEMEIDLSCVVESSLEKTIKIIMFLIKITYLKIMINFNCLNTLPTVGYLSFDI